MPDILRDRNPSLFQRRVRIAYQPVAQLARSSVGAHSFQAGVQDVDAGFVLPTRCEAMNASTSFGKNRTARPILQ